MDDTDNKFWPEAWRLARAERLVTEASHILAGLTEEQNMATIKPPIDRFDSTDDKRVENTGSEGNEMRHKYRTLNEDERAAMVRIKDTGQLFLSQCDNLGNSRELSLAKTKIEEAVMWAVKHITK